MAQGVVKLVVVENRLPSLIQLMPAAIERIVREQVRETTEDVKANIVKYDAIDTGDMLHAVEGHMTGATSGEVNSPAPYSAFVDRGTYKMAGRPFFEEAKVKGSVAFPQRFVDEMNKTL